MFLLGHHDLFGGKHGDGDQGGGAGKYLAQWMVHGQAEINMREFDPRRFGNWAAASSALPSTPAVCAGSARPTAVGANELAKPTSGKCVTASVVSSVST